MSACIRINVQKYLPGSNLHTYSLYNYNFLLDNNYRCLDDVNLLMKEFPILSLYMSKTNNHTDEIRFVYCSYCLILVYPIKILKFYCCRPRPKMA